MSLMSSFFSSPPATATPVLSAGGPASAGPHPHPERKSLELSPSSTVCRPVKLLHPPVVTMDMICPRGDNKGDVVLLGADEPSMPLLRTVASRIFGPKGYRTRMGTSLGFVTTTSTGQINVQSNVSTIGAIPEFTSFTNIFDEFFVHSMTLTFEPVGQYIGAQTFSSATQIVSTQLYWVSLFHGTSAYSAASPANAMLNNVTVKLSNSGRPFRYRWTNNEDPNCGVSTVSTTSSPPPTQSWCLTQNASVYAGLVQIQAYSGVGPTSGNVLFGMAAVHWDVSFRARA